ncbi:unnamed protein product [Dovyalis caffra]|uniref:Uncharacterized protein n=1 Tax=Dovyalis caffra TaxID=77055 RepID=A0AAV1SAE4_9ROSI|nr:unnamed protein product [Dovyalis caffra]
MGRGTLRIEYGFAHAATTVSRFSLDFIRVASQGDLKAQAIGLHGRLSSPMP